MRRIIALTAALLAGAAVAGPPYLTDDPIPTDTGHWENYAPYIESSGKGGSFAGSTGVELNYGAVTNVQLTLGLPISYAHDAGHWTWGRGDLELSAKYRFYHDDGAGLSIAVFPAISLPTASHDLGNRKVTGFIPVWAQKDIGDWSIFGGGGYAVNPGPGNRNYWTGGIAVTRQLGKALQLGIEIDPQGPDTDGAHASINFGFGAIYHIGGPFRLLASAGPTFTKNDDPPGFHGYAALGVDF